MAKFYCVWEGRQPGVYDNWNDAEEQILNFKGARYKSFNSAAEAAEAFRKGCGDSSGADLGSILIAAADRRDANDMPSYKDNPDIDLTAWAVDASCQGNPGLLEYRGVDLATGQQLFRVGPMEQGTNNIGEFLAIVHALAEMKKRGEWHTIYSDSKTAMAWVRNRQVKTQLKPTEKNRRVFDLLARALAWVRANNWPVRILKWQTELWGEIPADFNRK
ncbi:MAG: ribonuclease H family protein [Muribaculaceae bacterium]|nr:ribonuclease H family protein [Muribaculaceae bacterium]